MAVQERLGADDRETLVAKILEHYPPVDRMETIMGPEPTFDELAEVDAFLRARSQWQQPYSRVPESRSGKVTVRTDAAPETSVGAHSGSTGMPSWMER